MPEDPLMDLTERALYLYYAEGVIPGDFLQAVIKNDLREAVLRADARNGKRLRPILQMFYYFIPSRAWGSYEQMEAWAKAKGVRQFASEGYEAMTPEAWHSNFERLVRENEEV